jgi:Putative Ig domain./Domain of unknown function (DUF2341).
MIPVAPVAMGGGTLTYSAVGLPPGLSINTNTGEITGTPVTTGDTAITLTVTGTNATGEPRSDSETVTVRVSDPSLYPYKMDLTFSGYTGSSAIKDFPAVVDFHQGLTVSGGTQSANFSYNTFLSPTAADLRFFGANGRELPYEIEDWNSSGHSRVWVNVGDLIGTGTVVTAAWGNAQDALAPDYIF